MPIEPVSITRVCNGALVHLGEGRQITAIDDGSPLANLFTQVWDDALGEVLADHPWNCALRRADLPASGDFIAAGSEYTQGFEKPADCIRWLPWSADHPDYFVGEEEGKYILSSDAAPLSIRYIARIEDLLRWTPGMVAALSVKLARKVAKAVTGQTVMIDRMETLYQDTLNKAKRQDGGATGNRSRQLIVQSNWLTARNRPWNGR
jgi:hypothetical protein